MFLFQMWETISQFCNIHVEKLHVLYRHFPKCYINNKVKTKNTKDYSKKIKKYQTNRKNRKIPKTIWKNQKIPDYSKNSKNTRLFEKFKKYQTIRINRKSRGKIDISNRQIHNGSLSWLNTVTSINKNGGVKLLIWTHTSLLN